MRYLACFWETLEPFGLWPTQVILPGSWLVVPAPEEGDFGILEPAIEPPAGGFDACGARAVPGRTATLEKSLYPF